MYERCRLNNIRSAAIVLALFLVTGCLSTNRTLPRYAWETAQEPEYREVFRGRWWNYYDRGLWNQLRGNYAAAEEDLRTAQRLRTEDQLWPRTYGMHFMREYFPKRELGITLYQTERYDEAASLLESSLEEQYSARASYYLDLARTQMLVASGVDTQAPAFELLSPDPNSVAGAIYTDLVGIATDDHYVAKVFVNGETVDFDRSRPRQEVKHAIALTADENEIEVEVVDLLGKSSVTRYALAADHSGPVISFDDYDLATRTIRGTVYDSSGVEEISIGGRPMTLGISAEGVHPFEYTADDAELTAGVAYRSVDSKNNVSQGVVTDAELRQARGLKSSGAVRVAMATTGIHDGALLAQAEPALDLFAAELLNITDDQRFYQEAITINLKVTSPVPIQQIAFNGQDVEIRGSPTYVRLSRAVALGNTPTDVRCRVDATNQRGEVTSDEKLIHRELSKVETDEYKLSLAFMDARSHYPKISDVNTAVLSEIQRNEAFLERFGQPVVRDPGKLQEMFVEKKLGELSDKEYSVLAGEVITADVFIDTEVTGDEDSVQIVLEGRSSSVNRVITGRVEVAGSPTMLPNLIETLTTRLIQEFPRLQRPAVSRNNLDIEFAMTAADGIRQNYNCVLVERQVLTFEGFEDTVNLEPISEGRITSVRPRGLSQAQFAFGENVSREMVFGPPYENYFVITK